ncbi:MAG TPA: hypothetical protein VGJ21_11060 [Terracidiphilus sp.]
MLMVVVLSPLAAVCQGLPEQARQTESASAAGQPQPNTSQPDSSPPAQQALTPPDGQWRKIQRLPVGVEILVRPASGSLAGCRFAAATDETLYCNEPGNATDPGLQFCRADVLSVQATILHKNHHPVWIASMIAGGVITGILATSGASAGRAAGIGVVGAAITGVIGGPLALSSPDERWVTVIYRPRVSRLPARAAQAHGH